LERHGSSAEVAVRAPGRINLIGEHTDYNQGLAMPGAIDRAVYVLVSARPDHRMVLEAEGFAPFEGGLDAMEPIAGAWHNYVRGIVGVLSSQGHRLGGFSLYVTGDIPAGAGLSSSAALCCGTVMALDRLFRLGLSREAMAGVAQAAEHRYAGVECGLMDQYACLFGRKGHVLLLDFETMAHELVPLDLKGARLVLLDTGVKHSLGDTAYNLRRQQCRKAAEMASFGRADSLRQVRMAELCERVMLQDAEVFARARFVLDENERVSGAAGFLNLGDLVAVGDLMFSSHKGLRDGYQVSCPELDFLVERASRLPGVLGSRMMGGGFGGCTINLVADTQEDFKERMSDAYLKAFGRELKAYGVSLSDGAEVLEDRRNGI